MVSRIKLLDTHCINQIAAGEVVERPLSVVKELVENSLDAGARKLEISVEGGGNSLIRVKDDGAGIIAEDLRLAVLPHATSKITTITDLDNLRTLGFRGEALPSIASVSKLSIISRTQADVSGQELTVAGGTFISLLETGCPYGTMVTVRDLFYNTPARQKFLRSASTEFGWISDMVSRLALARPDVAFSLRHPTNLILQTPGNGNLLDTIAAVNGHDTARKMLPVSHTGEKLTIAGYISLPEQVRSSRSSITFIVNGRVIRSQLLNQALKDGYHTLIPSGTYPISVLSLIMDPRDYDVNVHPAKLEIKFKAEKELSRQLADTVRKALLDSIPVRGFSAIKQEQYTIPLNDSKYIDPKISNGSMLKNKPSNWEQLKILYQQQVQETPSVPAVKEAFADNQYNSTMSELLTNQGVKANSFSDAISNEKALIIENQLIGGYPYHTDKGAASQLALEQAFVSAQEHDSEPKYTPESDKNELPSRSKFLEIYAIGQVFNTYILAADEKKLYIIDQHAAHERIRYEELLRLAKQSTSLSQQLLIPETVELTAQEEQIMLAYFEYLHEMGFIIEHFGDRTYFLKGVPILNNLESPGKLFQVFLDEILNTSYSPSREKMIEEWIYMMACRSAIKARERLVNQEMDEIIQTLGKAENPYSCPHGRPTIIEITIKELAQRFGRE